MAERDDPVGDANDDLDRIEAALDRIAASRPQPAPVDADTTVIAARLDGLIARLRDALAIATS